MPPKKRKQSFAGEITTNGKHGWTAEADDFIKQYIEDHGKTAAIWDELAGAMGHARTASAVRSRWYMLCGPSAATGGRSKGGAAKRQRKTPTAPPGAPPAAAAATADGAQPQEQQPEQVEAEGGDSGASPQSDGGLARTSSGRRVRASPPSPLAPSRRRKPFADSAARLRSGKGSSRPRSSASERSPRRATPSRRPARPPATSARPSPPGRGGRPSTWTPWRRT